MGTEKQLKGHGEKGYVVICKTCMNYKVLIEKQCWVEFKHSRQNVN